MGAIELRCFSKLQSVMAEKGFKFPEMYEVGESITGVELIHKLEITPEQVEAIMINGKVQSLETVIKSGDRVALIPPGTPGPYRVILGLVNKE
ncbi:MoaD/ThiS family protein [Desulforamulus aquiferis]|uniref:MoaD/ThiS family protein n=1 Tax=Desulforamulus aquiferis TaxID=1397668 RepID=A0AAW7ZGH2_9FIRM|nr:MoaD/ThiS family protein [Desulforamulus aquiferis]MDO7788521.1 MoaD/ThiS family protein [Desulforamulus aquiferis]RYD01951.1 hypothetical protein N752_27910 [Desulforamulus aquiferis]